MDSPNRGAHRATSIPRVGIFNCPSRLEPRHEALSTEGSELVTSLIDPCTWGIEYDGMGQIGNMEMTENSIEAFVAERDAVLLSGDVQKLREWYAKMNPGLRPPPTEVMEVSMHKARTGALSLPDAEREASKKWLLERGYSHFADER